MKLVVQIQPKAAAELLSGKSARPEIAGLMQSLRAAGAALEPLHPGTDDAELKTWFQMDAPEGADVRALADGLLAHQPVLAAYPKPQDESP